VSEVNVQRTSATTTPTRAARAARRREGGPTTSAVESAPHGESPFVRSAREAGVDPNQAATLAILISGSGDPMAMMLGMQSRLREMGVELREQDVESADGRSITEEAERTEALDQARAAAEKAIKRMPKWVKKLVGAILTAVGTVASVFTGGASVALTVIGVVLLVAGEVVQALADRGVIDERNGSIAAMAIKLVAAVVMCVASCGANTGGLVNAGQQAAQIGAVVADVARYTQATVSTVTSAMDTQRAVCEFHSTNFRIDASEHELNRDIANEEMEESSEAIIRLMRVHQRVAERIRAAVQARDEAMVATAQAFA